MEPPQRTRPVAVDDRAEAPIDDGDGGDDAGSVFDAGANDAGPPCRRGCSRDH